jgi:hypothetical protein
MILLTEIQYHPPVRYFALAARSEKLLIERHENYNKQTYRNRCHILTSQGPITLIVPVVKGNRKIPISLIEIDYSQKWVETHWRTLRSAYGSAPFFPFYADFIWNIYKERPKYLFDLNLNFLRLYLRLLGLRKQIDFTKEYYPDYDQPVVDLRNLIHPKINPADNLDVKPYRQVFGKQFAPGLSILDLLFSQGPQAQDHVRDSSPAI